MDSQDKLDLTQALKGLGDRISKIADLMGGKKSLARTIGISESQLYRYISGDSQPTVEPLAAIARCGQVHLDWLVLGEGPTGIAAEINDLKAIYSSKQEYIAIPELKDDEHTDSAPTRQVGKLSFNHFWLVKAGLNPENLRLLRAQGDAMAPTIRDGDLLMIDIKQNIFDGDAIYVLKLEQRMVPKRLQQSIDRGLYLVSDNSAYREHHIPDAQKRELNIIGKVVWSAGLF
ncbi:MAG TPA: XRE family transcriptional regulator [Gammaproteobacteria bacterium]